MILSNVILSLLLSGNVLALASQPCRCHCLDLRPQLLCDSVAAAHQHLGSCALDYACPDTPASSPSAAVSFDDLRMPAGSTNCRAVRLWDDERQAYTGATVCDLLEPKG